MADPRVEKLGQLLVNYCVAVQPGDKVVISGGLVTRPLMQVVFREVVKAGGHPLVRWEDNTLHEIFLKEASDEQLQYIHEPTLHTLKNYVMKD